MITPRKKSSVLTIGVFALMASLLTWTAEPLGMRVKLPLNTVTRPQPAAPSKGPANPSLRMLAYDEMHVVTARARRIEAMMSVAESAQTRVVPQGLRDPDGRVGIFIVCSQPFVTPANTSGTDVRKQWVMLAVFASVKHTEGSPVTVDYIGFTDPQGLSGARWFYKLDMSAARLVQRQLFAGTITIEQGYDMIVGAWRRITPVE